MKHALVLVTAVLFGQLATLQADQAQPQRQNPAAAPAPRDGNWRKSFDKKDARLQQEESVDILLVGDSITRRWDDYKEAQRHVFGARKVFNLGYPADRTENMLWRLEHHHLDKISPRVAIVMAGTNNSNGDECSAEEIAGGVQAVVKLLRKRLPHTKVLLLGIFPRGSREQRGEKTLTEAGRNSQWEKNDKASLLASRIADGENIVYLNINQALLSKDGKLSRDIMPDLLHPSEKGYELWAAAMKPTLEKMLASHKFLNH